jgi:uncharacterized membrane protein
MSSRKVPVSHMELVISSVLQIGVGISVLVILIGLISFFTHGTPHSASYHQYTSPAFSFPHSISAIRNSIQTNQGSGLIELGVLFLILTPVIRVITSIFLFVRQHDRPMAIITLSVLLILSCSFILGIAIQ